MSYTEPPGDADNIATRAQELLQGLDDMSCEQNPSRKDLTMPVVSPPLARNAPPPPPPLSTTFLGAPVSGWRGPASRSHIPTIQPHRGFPWPLFLGSMTGVFVMLMWLVSLNSPTTHSKDPVPHQNNPSSTPKRVSEEPIAQHHATVARDTCGDGAGWLVIGPTDEDLRASIRRDFCADAFINTEGQLQVARYSNESEAKMLAAKLSRQTGMPFFVRAEPSTKANDQTAHPDIARSSASQQESFEDRALPKTTERADQLSSPDQDTIDAPLQEYKGKCTFMSAANKNIVDDLARSLQTAARLSCIGRMAYTQH